MALSQTEMCVRLSALGLRQPEVHRVLDRVTKWIDSSGEEWTVKRLKSLKALLLHDMANEDLPKIPWIKVDGHGIPKGDLSCLFSDKSFKQRKRGLNALMCYSSLYATRATPAQEAKFYGSMTSTDLPSDSTLSSVFVGLKKRGLPRGYKPHMANRLVTPQPLETFVFGNSKAPVPGGKSVPEFDVCGWWAKSADDGTVRVASQRFREVYSGLGERLYHETRKFPSSLHSGKAPFAGNISFIQEPGYKLRAIANPNRIHQVALEPLKVKLWSLLRLLPRDCTYNQQSGVDTVQGWLKEGKVVHSIDLSDATNHMSLKLQIMLMKHILQDAYHPYVDAFEFVATREWKCPDGKLRSFTKGQPLGLGPSFAMFALTNHSLAHAACNGNGGDYRILGDDIVIIGDAAAKVYLRVLEALRCPISAEKSISSHRVAEFAGKVITPLGVIQTLKWRTPSDNSFLDFARNFGPQCLPMLRPRQRALIKVLAEVPDDLGGLGWNPAGKSWAQRVKDNPIWESLVVVKERPLHASSFRHSLDRLDASQKSWRSSLGSVITGGSVAAPDKPTRPVDGDLSPWERILRSTGIAETQVPVNHPLPKGFKPLTKESGDPRGPTRLSVLEDVVSEWYSKVGMSEGRRTSRNDRSFLPQIPAKPVRRGPSRDR
jgi:hypothetical protein